MIDFESINKKYVNVAAYRSSMKRDRAVTWKEKYEELKRNHKSMLKTYKSWLKYKENEFVDLRKITLLQNKKIQELEEELAKYN